MIHTSTQVVEINDGDSYSLNLFSITTGSGEISPSSERIAAHFKGLQYRDLFMGTKLGSVNLGKVISVDIGQWSHIGKSHITTCAVILEANEAIKYLFDKRLKVNSILIPTHMRLTDIVYFNEHHNSNCDYVLETLLGLNK